MNFPFSCLINGPCGIYNILHKNVIASKIVYFFLIKYVLDQIWLVFDNILRRIVVARKKLLYENILSLEYLQLFISTSTDITKKRVCELHIYYNAPQRK